MTSTGAADATGTYRNVEPEFVAVVLASTVGARLFPLSSSTQPKHLLPAAGLPLLERLLHALADFPQVFIAIAADDQTTVPSLFAESDIWQAVVTEQLDGTTATGTTTVTTTTTVGGGPPTAAASASHFPQPHSVWQSKPTPSTVLPPRVTIVRMPDECPGSAEVLRQLEGLLPRTAHTLVVPSDLVVTDIHSSLAALLQAHRQGSKHTASSSSSSNNACTVLLQDVGEQDEHGVPLKESAKAKKGGLARDAADMEYMALGFMESSLSSNTARFLWKMGKLDAEQDEAFTLTGQTPKLPLPKARLRGGSVKVRQDWTDLHVYVLAPWVVRLVQVKTSLVSLQADLLPLLIRRQWLGKVETFGQSVEPHIVTEILEEDAASGSMDAAGAAATTTTVHETGTSTIPPPTLSTAAIIKPQQTYAVLAHVGNGAMRASTLPAYLYMSKDLLQKMADSSSQGHGVTRENASTSCLRLPVQASLNTKFVSLQLKDSTVGEKPTLKASIVGQRCRLGNKCRLNNVVLMNDVQLGDNVVLQNTIVGAGAVIGDNCSLNDCQVAAGMHVASGTKEKGEVLIANTATVG